MPIRANSMQKPEAGPRRIVCLTEETTEWLYLLGEQDRIVGISAYTERPPQAKQEKPVVSAFIGGSVEKIKALDPDLVIGFSDVQANLARDLIQAQLPVLITNQRSVDEILETLAMVGRIIHAESRATELIESYRARIETMLARRQASTNRPKVYFEEWDEPRISAIQWVSELIEIAGGRNIFRDRANEPASAGRHVTDDEIIERAPDIFIGCWCGKPLDEVRVLVRPGYDTIPAIRDGRLYEMDPAIILQPGPASLTDGLDALTHIFNTNDD